MNIKGYILILLTFGLMAQKAFGHGGEESARPHNFAELWRSWEFDPLVVTGLTLSAGLYAMGLKRLWSATHIGSGVRCWEATAFLLGWLSAVLALVSPLHPWGRALFSAHMTQHEILMLVSAPLMVLGRPLIVFLRALPAEGAQALVSWSRVPWWSKVWHVISGAFAAWFIHMVALWMWHVPALFDATIDSEWVHALQHTSFLFTALLFWWAVMQGKQKALGYGLAVLYMFTTALHSGLLGALLTFTNSPWYPAYQETTLSWGLTPLEDQQLGGLIMWIPASVVYIVAGVALFAGWLRESESRASRQNLAGSLAAPPTGGTAG